MSEQVYNITITRTTTVQITTDSLSDAFDTVKEMYEGGDACAELGDATYCEAWTDD